MSMSMVGVMMIHIHDIEAMSIHISFHGAVAVVVAAS
mgnify:CR=1 FL=1